jgi:uncharacterized membrane protein YedE/YeeE
MKRAIASFISGLVFSLGLALSGMTLPSKVLAFLDVTGKWDPSLAFVMGAALLVIFIARALAPKRPVLSTEFSTPEGQTIDGRLVSGALVFGIGWGLSGFCPGPAVVSIGAGTLSAVCFVPAMLVGMAAHRVLLKGRGAPRDLEAVRSTRSFDPARP